VLQAGAGADHRRDGVRALNRVSDIAVIQVSENSVERPRHREADAVGSVARGPVLGNSPVCRRLALAGVPEPLPTPHLQALVRLADCRPARIAARLRPDMERRA
jgi:hypothetical protein